MSIRKDSHQKIGLVIISTTVSDPWDPQMIGNQVVAFVPILSEVRFEQRDDLTQSWNPQPKAGTIGSYLVAMSDDKGRTWKFFEALPASIEALLPGAKGKLVMPDKLIDSAVF